MTRKFDPSKPVMTRDGRKATILTTSAKFHSGRTIAALIHNTNNDDSWQAYYHDGLVSTTSEFDYDLVNIPVKKEGWIGIYLGSTGSCRPSLKVYPSEDECRVCCPRAIAVIKIEWEQDVE